MTGVALTVDKSGSQQTQFRVTSCRHSSPGCLTVAELLALLTSEDVASRFEQMTGASYAATEAVSEHSGDDESLYQTLTSAFWCTEKEPHVRTAQGCSAFA